MTTRTSLGFGGLCIDSKRTSDSTVAFVITESSSSKQKNGSSPSSGMTKGPTCCFALGTARAWQERIRNLGYSVLLKALGNTAYAGNRCRSSCSVLLPPAFQNRKPGISITWSWSRFASRARPTQALRNSQLAQPWRPAARYPQSPAARARSCGAAAEPPGAVKPAQSLVQKRGRLPLRSAPFRPWLGRGAW